MEKLFGIPIQQLLTVLLIIFGILVTIMAFFAVRNRVIFKMGLRNAPRRRSQSILIILGLMLATLLFSATFTTGDTLTHSMRIQALQQIGEIDILVQSKVAQTTGQPAYYNETRFQEVRGALSGTEAEGIAPLITEVAPIIAPDTGLNEARVQILGYDPEWMDGFDRLEDSNGQAMSISSLTPGQVFISSVLADELAVNPGDAVVTYLGSAPSVLEVSGIYEKGAYPSGDLSLVMLLTQLQTLTGNDGMINSIIITNQGDPIEGAGYTDNVLSSLEPVLDAAGLEAVTVKQDALDSANEAGSSFSTIFLLFGQFSIAAGILLIFLIFIMLAAERKSELGIARAIGAYRGHVIRMFAFEGAIYALIAAAIGSLLGVAAGWGMVRLIAVAFGQEELNLSFAVNWRSLVLAYVMGTVLTFIVVIISSWRVSRLNIVRAIRDIPEPRISRKTVRGLVLAILVPVIGILLTVSGIQGAQLAAFTLGVSLIIIGLPLLARRFGLSDRIAFTIAGLGIVTWWLIPASVFESVLPEMQAGMEMFFLSGIMLVIGAVWTVIYNSDLLLNAIVKIFGRIRGLPPVLKTAISYPMQNRFRTGITLAMFSLVVFTLIVMAFMINSMTMIFQNTERLSGGFDIRTNTGYANPIPDIEAAIHEKPEINPDDFRAIGSLSGAPISVKQEGTDQEFVDFFIQGANPGYTESVSYDFEITTAGYESWQQVWETLQKEPGTVIVSSNLVPTQEGFTMGETSQDFQFEGFFIEDETIPETFILVRDPLTGTEHRLRVIAVLAQDTFYVSGILTSQETVDSLLSQPVTPLGYMFKLEEGVDADMTARTLETAFVEHGMQASVIADEINDAVGSTQMINVLFQGFMGLGLLVGIAALGVIAARSVVERRKQIGVLRALGFQKSMVQFSFLLESSFIALLGIGLGIALGAGLSVQIVGSMKESFPGLTYQVPWVNIIVVIVIAYGASLLTTFLPARQAAKIYPAEALRFE